MPLIPRQSQQCLTAGLRILTVLALTSLGTASGAEAPFAGPLRVHPQNPRYFTDDSGRAIYLTGSHTWPSLVDMDTNSPPRVFDFTGFLNFLQQHGHNFVRLWTWETTAWGQHINPRRPSGQRYAGPLPYARTGPGVALDGKPKYDLARFNPEYFERLRSRVQAARDRGIYVSVMLFEGYGVQFYRDGWRGHPYHAPNNLNGIEADKDGDGLGVEVHQLVNPAVTALQEAYVRKVIDTVNDLDNVLFEISNENHPASTAWQYHMIRFIKNYEQTRPRQHPVGMTFQYRGGSNQTLFDSPADWISPNPDAADGFNFRTNPPPGDGRKVVVSDTDHLWGIGGNVAWVWMTFLRGHHPIFMDPYERPTNGQPADVKWDPVRRNLGHTLRMARKTDLVNLTPSLDVASSQFCLANRGAEYLVYLRTEGSVTVDLTDAQGRFTVEWFNPETGKTQVSDAVTGGDRRTMQSPFTGHAVLHLKKQ